MKNNDETQPIKNANFPNCSTDRLKKWREQSTKKRDEKLEIAQRHPVGTPWHTRATREAESCTEKISTIDKVLSERGEQS
jgi:hypothetical protein